METPPVPSGAAEDSQIWMVEVWAMYVGPPAGRRPLNQPNSYKGCFFINSRVSTHWALSGLCSKVLWGNAKQLLLVHLK